MADTTGRTSVWSTRLATTKSGLAVGPGPGEVEEFLEALDDDDDVRFIFAALAE